MRTGNSCALHIWASTIVLRNRRQNLSKSPIGWGRSRVSKRNRGPNRGRSDAVLEDEVCTDAFAKFLAEVRAKA